MATIPKRVYKGQPGISTAVLATVGASKRWMSVQVIVCNTSAVAATLTLGVNGSTAADSFVRAASILGNTTETIDLGTGLVLSAAETIDGFQGTASSLTVFIGVIEEDV